MWVGFNDGGGISRIKDGRVTNMARAGQDNAWRCWRIGPGPSGREDDRA
jgi:hypothetical protein